LVFYIKEDLILNINSSSHKVYNEKIFDDIFQDNNHYEFFEKFKHTLKLTYNSKMNGYTKIKEAIKIKHILIINIYIHTIQSKLKLSVKA
jgi:hypothetical protein